jgi:hypothetical protein
MTGNEQLVNAVIKSSVGQKSGDKNMLSCAEAFKLAKKLNAEIIEIGRICNEHNIRICKCQLGCFK